VKDRFFSLADRLTRETHTDEALLLWLSGERSDFVRFNHGRVRQAGSVAQQFLTLRLVRNRCQAAATITLAGDGEDEALARTTVTRLRDTLVDFADDPWLAIAEHPESTTHERRGSFPSAEEMVNQVITASDGRDLVGLYAGGSISRGFANSFGQRNWHAVDCFNLDWSLHLHSDKAVKCDHAGFDWDPATFEAKQAEALRNLALLEAAPRTIEPGEYRAYLAPSALDELAGLLGWGGFSARARATRQGPLLRMEHGESLSPKVTLVENTADGIAPSFQRDGYLKPPSVTLVESGRLGAALVSPRSAKEYGLETNAANGRESPESLDMAGGALGTHDVLAALDTGLYIGNLWYTNFSDRPAGRITGMTRFATFWVERGRIVAPVNVMRFDDTLYRMLGANLVELTAEREFVPDPGTYGERSTSSARLPGMLVSAMRFTL
jgi:predicted Zn-dependent protease